MVIPSESEAYFLLLVLDLLSFPFLHAKIWMCPEAHFGHTNKDNVPGMLKKKKRQIWGYV